jgi:hypothetical protein
VFILGPIIAFAVIAALAAILRWSFDSDLARTQARVFGSRAASGGRGDFGLLRTAAIVDDIAKARHMQELLRDAGIRSTIANEADGRMRVLVFEKEIDEARRLVSGWAI